MIFVLGFANRPTCGGRKKGKMKRKLIRYTTATKLGMIKELDEKFLSEVNIAYVVGKSAHKSDNLEVGDRIGDDTLMWEIVAN